MEHADLSPLTDVVARLLAPDGCPWDRAQNHRSMRKHMIEEAYEACDAIDRNDMVNLCEELGDVLYQVVFHAALAESENAFTLQEVIDGVAEKMKRRHPAIYPPDDVNAPKDWESIKRQEKEARHQPTTLPAALPVTLKLTKLSAKLRKAGVSEEDILSLCNDDTERALLQVVLDAGLNDRNVEFSGQSLANRMENMLENTLKSSEPVE
ncbi:MAG: MazG nucleotide pyrophosphohydrolase domain-containing protein [Peptococcaceae bacterium]|nr:MazG nucleotide pyrophosphohydrolase domain-containing protein [Peptococcaceae bacterium]